MKSPYSFVDFSLLQNCRNLLYSSGMFTDEQLNQLRELFKPIIEKLEGQRKQLGSMESRLETLEIKVETIHVQNKKDHAEIIEKLAESNETHGNEQRELRKKIEHLEHAVHGTRS